MKRLAKLLQPRALLVAMHIPFIAFTAAHMVTGWGLDATGQQWIALPLVLVAGSIQIRHSLAAAEGVRPRNWQWTLAFVLLLAAAAHLTLGWYRTLIMHWFVVASLWMLLPGRVGPASAFADAVGVASLLSGSAIELGDSGWMAAWEFPYIAVVLLAGGGGLYAAARLVWYAAELHATRAKLAELAIDHEQLRIARDLHDLLGQSLSAVALKGDLANGLLERQDVGLAVAEIESLVSVARSAFHDLREIAHHQPAVSLASELNRGSDVLAAVGIEARIARGVENLPPKVDELFAWAVREGVTNVVRHSAATTCSISIECRDRRLRLEIENDGAGLASIDGSGLSGLVARATELAGKARGHRVGAGRFVLNVDVPEAEGAA